MEENVYVTDYPKKLREEAQKRNIEFEESTYEFIDMFLHYHIDSYDGSLYRVEIEVENVTNNIRLILYTEEKHKIEMLIPGGRVTDIEFSSRIARIPKGTADEVARRIQKGSFIHNELLDVETTLQKAKGPWSDLVMKSWFMRADQEGVEACSTYLVYFNEEIYQITPRPLCFLQCSLNIQKFIMDKAAFLNSSRYLIRCSFWNSGYT